MEGQIRLLTSYDVIDRVDTLGSYRCLQGIVVGGSQEKPLAPSTNARFTLTSPIKEVNKDHVITESGTTYILVGQPSSQYLQVHSAIDLEFSPEDPIAPYLSIINKE